MRGGVIRRLLRPRFLRGYRMRRAFFRRGPLWGRLLPWWLTRRR